MSYINAHLLHEIYLGRCGPHFWTPCSALEELKCHQRSLLHQLQDIKTHEGLVYFRIALGCGSDVTGEHLPRGFDEDGEYCHRCTEQHTYKRYD